MFEQSITEAVADYRKESQERWSKKLEKAESLRDQHEEKIQEIIGRELNSTEMYLLRYQFRQLEESETDIERIEEHIKY